MRTKTVIDRLEIITTEIREGVMLLDLIYKSTGGEEPQIDSSIACLLRSLNKTVEKADSLSQYLNVGNEELNQ